MNGKEVAARHAVALLQDGMVVGLGSGTTVDYAIAALVERMQQGLKVRLAVASARSETLARQAGLNPEELDTFDAVDIVIDGADEVDPLLNLVKGGGGALVREKLLARAGREPVIAVDEHKCVPILGAFPLPVAIIPFGAKQTINRLAKRCSDLALRMRQGKPFVTDDGLWIVDLRFRQILDPAAIERDLKAETGVVEVGLFVGLANRVVVGYPDGHIEEIVRSA